MNADDKQLAKLEPLDKSVSKTLYGITAWGLARQKEKDPRVIKSRIDALMAVHDAAARTKIYELLKAAQLEAQWHFRRLGELLTAVPRNKGGRPTKNPRKATGGFPTLKELGLTEEDAGYSSKLAKLPEWAFKHAVENQSTPSKAQMEREVKRFAELAHLVEEDCLRAGGLKESEKEATMERFYLEGYILHQAEVELTGKREGAEDVDYGTEPDDDDPPLKTNFFLEDMLVLRKDAEDQKSSFQTVKTNLESQVNEPDYESGLEAGKEALNIYRKNVAYLTKAFLEAHKKSKKKGGPSGQSDGHSKIKGEQDKRQEG